MIGRALNERYELVEILGVGGMATVWRGVDRVLGRQVAVKVLNGGLADDPRFAERFGREAQHAAMLAHPRIVMVFDSGVDQGSPYIVMELVHGRSLAALLAEQPGLPVERAVGIAAAVCEALEVAHGAGLVHRDIKPGNIMITYDGGVKVVDFGIARAGSSGAGLTQAATVLGTAAYLSPEQATAAAVDGRSDLYAVGCVMTEMLTGEPPFTADTPVAIAFKQVSEQPLPPSARRPGIPPALDAAVLRLLAKNPGDRPYDAAAARAELLAAVPALPTGSAADRTAELLAGADLARPLFPGGPQNGADQQHTTVLPPVPGPGHHPATGHPAPPGHAGPATALMPPVPVMPSAGQAPPYGAAFGDTGRARQPARRRPLLLGALGVAGVAGAAVIAIVALDGPPAGKSSTPPAVTRSAAGSPVPISPTAAPSTARPSATASPAPTKLQGPAAQLLALRELVAKAQLQKERDKQAELLRALDDAGKALAAGQEADAQQELKDAQRIVRDLAKKHAIDTATSLNWQARLTVLLNTVRPGAGVTDNDS
ncbi:protein kinase [Kitasatospora sp. NBC_00240]|uniref:protein kinase domain-containing protein n=1 Tax=Kitasatospora sp. NBC_00240 TaxID=2903567 RepID=UPI0022561019|nr:protein kinase [Kitasatospora sp. NBC_00240]MCX5212095.1 protein kinase [Kitasatospora sp. NBC_00240]